MVFIFCIIEKIRMIKNPKKIRDSLPDLLKGLAVLFMVQVHLMELFATTTIFNSSIGKVSLFLGGPTAAPIFMIIMGYYCSFNKGTVFVLKRGVKLILLGLLLNILLNFHLFTAIYFEKFVLNPWEYLWGVDILFLAGLSLLSITALRYFFKKRWYLYFSFALIIVSVSPFIQDFLKSDHEIRYLLAFFGGKYSWSYFAFFPWVAFPLVGYGIKLLHKKHEGFQLLPKIKLGISIVLLIIIAFTIKWASTITHDLSSYYHFETLFFIWTLLFLALYSFLVHLVDKHFGNSIVFTYVKWVGKNVTVFYFLQWIIIGNFATSLFKTQNLFELLLWNIGVVLICSLVIRFVLKKNVFCSNTRNKL